MPRRLPIQSTTNLSQSDQFLRFITQLNPRTTLAFDLFEPAHAQSEIPINVDPNNEFDPITTPATARTTSSANTMRFSHLTYTESSKELPCAFSRVT